MVGQGIAFAVGFLILGIGLIWFGYRRWTANRAKAAAAERWPEATAVVDKVHLHDDRSGCYPRIAYCFQIDDRGFSGNRLAFGEVQTHFKATALKMLAPYPQGSRIKIRYNPDDPRDNVVEPRIVNAWADPAIMVVGAFTMLIGAAFLVSIATY